MKLKVLLLFLCEDWTADKKQVFRTAGAWFLFPLSLFVGIFSGLTSLVLYNPFQIGGKDVSLRA